MLSIFNLSGGTAQSGRSHCSIQAEPLLNFAGRADFAERRTQALPQQAVDLLIAEHKKHSRNPYLFPSPKTGTMYDPDAFRRTHDKILKAIGAEHIRFHDLRHTFATLSLKSGVDVKTLSGALGHYSAGFTLNTYTHATAQMKQDAADTIGGVISQQMR